MQMTMQRRMTRQTTSAKPSDTEAAGLTLGASPAYAAAVAAAAAAPPPLTAALDPPVDSEIVYIMPQCGDGMTLPYYNAILGPPFAKRVASVPAIAAEYIDTGRCGDATLPPALMRIVSPLVRRSMRLYARGDVTCSVALANVSDPTPHVAGAFIKALCHVPANATSAGAAAMWDTLQAFPERMPRPLSAARARLAAAPLCTPIVPGRSATGAGPGTATAGPGAPQRMRTLTLLYIARSNLWGRRVFNQREMWTALHALAARMQTEHCIATRYLVYADGAGQDASITNDPAVLLKMFYQADIVLAVHGAGELNLVSARPGTHLVDITEDGDKRGMYWWPANLARNAGLSVTILPSTPVREDNSSSTSADGAVNHQALDVRVDVPQLMDVLQRLYLTFPYGRPLD